MVFLPTLQVFRTLIFGFRSVIFAAAFLNLMLPAGYACLVAETTTPIVTLNGSPLNCSVLLSILRSFLTFECSLP